MALDYDKTVDLVALKQRTRNRNAGVHVPVAIHGIDESILGYAEHLDDLQLAISRTLLPQ